MNILMLTHERNLNGASKSLLNLIDHMKDEHTFYVITPYLEGPVVDELKRRNISYFCHDMKKWMRRKPKSRIKWKLVQLKWYCFDQFINKREARKITKEIEGLSVDVIHTNVSVINVGGLVSEMTGIPHLWYIREFGEEDFNIFPVCSPKLLYKFIDAYSNTVVVISKVLRDKYQRLLHKVNIKLIYNGVGTENICYEKTYSIQRERINFLISGTIQAGKGQRIAVLACKELLKKGITNFRLYIAGRGSIDDLVDLFPEEAEFVTFLGQVDDMPALRKEMNIELVCSKSEAFGRVTVEAMMAGMPVIGSNSGGTPELIMDGETGFLFEPGNYIELSKIMESFILNQKEIENMGRRAQEYAIKHFTIQKCAQEVDIVYHSITCSQREQ